MVENLLEEGDVKLKLDELISGIFITNTTPAINV